MRPPTAAPIAMIGPAGDSATITAPTTISGFLIGSSFSLIQSQAASAFSCTHASRPPEPSGPSEEPMIFSFNHRHARPARSRIGFVRSQSFSANHLIASQAAPPMLFSHSHAFLP